MERCRIIFAGSGGQGIITAAIILAEAAVLYEGLNAVQSQSYGPEARGGASRSEVIISDEDIDYPKAVNIDLLLALTDEAFVINSFSKYFCMTGWRLGWLVLPRGYLDAIGKLIEFNTSCAPVFVQRGALAGLQIAADFVPDMVQRLRERRDLLVSRLAALPGVEVALPAGGMYAFFRIEGQDDSLAFAKQLVQRHGLGLAPGAAFGDEGEGWLRWCFASRDAQRLASGIERLSHALGL